MNEKPSEWYKDVKRTLINKGMSVRQLAEKTGYSVTTRRSIPLFNIVMPTLIFLMLQYRSFHTVFSSPESMGGRLRNCIRGKCQKWTLYGTCFHRLIRMNRATFMKRPLTG